VVASQDAGVLPGRKSPLVKDGRLAALRGFRPLDSAAPVAINGSTAWQPCRTPQDVTKLYLTELAIAVGCTQPLAGIDNIRFQDMFNAQVAFACIAPHNERRQ